MERYLVQPRDQIFVIGYGILSFAKNMGKKICKNISKNFSGKYSQKLLIARQKLLKIHLKLLQKEQFEK